MSQGSVGEGVRRATIGKTSPLAKATDNADRILVVVPVNYFEYVLGSEDFNARVAKSKFGKMPKFAKAASGYLSLQGDHGQVSFRNIKIRPIESKN